MLTSLSRRRPSPYKRVAVTCIRKCEERRYMRRPPIDCRRGDMRRSECNAMNRNRDILGDDTNEGRETAQ